MTSCVSYPFLCSIINDCTYPLLSYVCECNLLSSIANSQLPKLLLPDFIYCCSQCTAYSGCRKTHSRSKSQVSSLGGTVSMEYFYHPCDKSFSYHSVVDLLEGAAL